MTQEGQEIAELQLMGIPLVKSQMEMTTVQKVFLRAAVNKALQRHQPDSDSEQVSDKPAGTPDNIRVPKKIHPKFKKRLEQVRDGQHT